MMLEGACVHYARGVQADEMLAKQGIVYAQPIIDANGQRVGSKLKSHPAVAISNAAWVRVRAFCSEFGLSPVSRTRLTLEKPDTSAQDLVELLNRPREKKTPPVAPPSIQ